MTKWIFGVTIMLLLWSPNFAAGQTWSTVRSGIELLEGTFHDEQDVVGFLLLRVDPRKRSVKIVDTYSELGKTNSYAAYSVTDVKKKTGAFIVVNAGSTKSFTLPDPAGLLEVRGKIVSRANPQTPNAGILCLNPGNVSILKVPRGTVPCLEAVQRGPLLSHDFSLLTGSWKDRYRRTMVAVDGEGKLLIMVTKGDSTLAALASYLYASDKDLNIQSVLNLDGGGSCALLVGSVQNSDEGTKSLGNVNGLVASAIIVH